MPSLRISRETFHLQGRPTAPKDLLACSRRWRRPKGSPAKIADNVEDQIVALRLRRPRWGARKIRAEIQRQGLTTVPAVSTVHEILRRNDLISGRLRRRQLALRRFERPATNDQWQIEPPKYCSPEATKADRAAIEPKTHYVACAGSSSKVVMITASPCFTMIAGGQPGRGSSTNPFGRCAPDRVHRLVPSTPIPRPAPACPCWTIPSCRPIQPSTTAPTPVRTSPAVPKRSNCSAPNLPARSRLQADYAPPSKRDLVREFQLGTPLTAPRPIRT